jgi:exodeoxyribonuclease-5
MKFSPMQAAAIDAVMKWLRDPRGKQVFRLFGFAGSGKTTLAKEIAARIDGETLAACFTGKAALVLRKKGMTNASTLHSLIYKPVEDPLTGKTTFEINPDSALATASLLMVDEVSMVGEELGRDVCSFGTRILVLGDPAQLPPIKGEGYFTAQEPDIMLTEIHRQALENPIIRLSMDVREGRALVPGDYGLARVIKRATMDKDELRTLVLQADQVLCGMNATRRTFNTRMRQLKGLRGKGKEWEPTEGDRLVCLRNNKMKGLINGGLWETDIVSRKPSNQWFRLLVNSLDTKDDGVEVVIAPQFFEGTEKDMDWRDKKNSDEFDYGYTLTVHKSQGSQWDEVLLFDESGVFRDNRMNHAYTGITRAAERLNMIV